MLSDDGFEKAQELFQSELLKSSNILLIRHQLDVKKKIKIQDCTVAKKLFLILF